MADILVLIVHHALDEHQFNLKIVKKLYLTSFQRYWSTLLISQRSVVLYIRSGRRITNFVITR